MKKITSFIAGAAIMTIMATDANAEEVTVKKGDTLWSISEEKNVTIENIKEWNNLSSNLIKADEKLTIHEPKKHIVTLGDTLWSIATENEVDVQSLKKWNNIEDDLIVPGDILIVSNGNNYSKEEDKSASIETATASKQDVSNAKEMTVTATAYTAECTGCSGTTATGINLKEDRNKKVIAVDPAVIPLGSKVYVEGYGEAIAGDTGGAIKGKKIDVHVPTKEEAINWGRKEVTIKIMD